MERKFILSSPAVASNAALYLRSQPVDGTLEMVIRPVKKQRRIEANNYYWSRIAEVAEQAKVLGKQYSAESWHEMAKQLFLPELPADGETLEGYQKWAELPNGGRSLVGSTSKLTVRGFSNYTMQVEAWGAHELRVRFSDNREP